MLKDDLGKLMAATVGLPRGGRRCPGCNLCFWAEGGEEQCPFEGKSISLVVHLTMEDYGRLHAREGTSSAAAVRPQHQAAVEEPQAFSVERFATPAAEGGGDRSPQHRAANGVLAEPEQSVEWQRVGGKRKTGPNEPSGLAPGTWGLEAAAQLEQSKKPRPQRTGLQTGDYGHEKWKQASQQRRKAPAPPAQPPRQTAGYQAVPRVTKGWTRWDWAEWTRKTSADEWEQQRAAQAAAGGSQDRLGQQAPGQQQIAAAVRIQRRVRGMLASQSLQGMEAPTAGSPPGRAMGAASVPTKEELDRLDEEALEVARVEVEHQRAGLPDLALLEEAKRVHKPECGRCRKPMAVGTVHKMVYCGHCVDQGAKGHIGRGSTALFCGRQKCTSGMCVQCVRKGMQDTGSAELDVEQKAPSTAVPSSTEAGGS